MRVNISHVDFVQFTIFSPFLLNTKMKNIGVLFFGYEQFNIKLRIILNYIHFYQMIRFIYSKKQI